LLLLCMECCQTDLSHANVAFCLPWSWNHWNISCTFVKFSVGGRAQEQIFLVQKLAWLALERCSLARKNCQYTWASIFILIFRHENISCTYWIG
jgi:hypothetical protein